MSMAMATATRGHPDNTSWYKKVDPNLIWRKIRRVWVAVIRNVQFEDHRDYLYQERALNSSDKERISAECTSQDKTSKLLAILENRKPPTALHTFLESLKENSEHVLKMIEEAEPVDEDPLVVDDEEITRFIEMSLENDYEEIEGESIPLDALLKQLQKHAQQQKTSYSERIGEDLVRDVMEQVYPEVKIQQWTQNMQKGKGKGKGKGKKLQQKEEYFVMGLSKRLTSARKPYKDELDVKLDGDSEEDELLSDSDDSTTNVKARMVPSDTRKVTKSCKEFIDAGLEEWSIEDVGKWVEELSFGSESLRSTFIQECICGTTLAGLTFEDLEKIAPTMPLGNKKTMLSERDKLKNGLAGREVSKTNAATTKMPPRVSDVFRKFDSGSPITMYKHNSYLPLKVQHSDNLLEPVHNFVEIEDLGRHSSLRKFQTKALKFATACLNDRTNGTIHFGVEEDERGGKVVGIALNQMRVSEALEKVLQANIPSGDQDIFRNCVRPPKFVPVVGKDAPSERFIVEIDVVASFHFCKYQDFYARLGELRHYRFKEGVPVVQTPDQVLEFQKFKQDLASKRKNMESPQKVIKHGSKPDLRSKLIHLLCQGETTLEGDLYPILIFTKANKADHISPENVKQEFGFLKHFQWTAVFDFDNGKEGEASVYTFLEKEEEQLLKVFTVEDFDRSSTSNRRKPEAFQTVLDDMKNCNQRAWIFTNGYEPRRSEEMGIVQWKRSRSEGFKECVRFLKNDIPQGRAVLMFMLLSKDFDVVLEAADELCTRFQDQWLVLAETEEIASLWKDGIMKKNILDDRRDLDTNCVVGIPWEHVNETITQLLGEQEEGACQLPTSSGAFVTLSERIKNDLVDLEILSRNQYDDVEIDETKLSQHSVQTEEKFYKGGEVDWWNFWFQSHVYKRSCYSDLNRQVVDALSDMQEEKRVGRVYLYHQPGSGGTTTARHILWDLKDQYRCAVVKTITDQTCHQISTLHTYKDMDPKPVLLLLDNMDEERISDLRAELEDKAKQVTRHDRDNPEGVFYAFLVCHRGSKPPSRKDGRQCVLKHELEPGELNWFKEKYQSLERDFHEKKDDHGLHPKHLISFNIMKENFSHEYIKKTVKECVKEITDAKERTLLKYISLLNAYDVTFVSILSSAFDPIMSFTNVKRRWELHLSQPLKVLLIHSSKPRDGHRIRIINNLLSKEILGTLTDAMDAGDEQLGDVALEFLNSRIFLSNNSCVEYLETVVRRIAKRRAKRPDGMSETKFAPLIQTIVDDQSQGIPKASEVLIKVFDMTEDVFVAQQVARLYIHAQDWEKALSYAKIATKAKSDSSFLWDTHGHVYKSQIVQKYNECIASGKHVSSEEARKVVDLAIVAVEIFQKEQKISQEEKTRSTTNNAGYFGEITVIVQLLDYLNYVDGLTPSDLHQFLVDESFVPVQLQGLGTETIRKMRGLQNGAIQAMAQLEDEYLQLRDDMADDYRRTEAQKRIDVLIKLKENIENYYGEENDEVPRHLTPEEECKYRRRRVFRLGGSTLRGMFDILKNVKKTKAKAEETLKTIRRLVQDNLRTPHSEASDLQSLLMVNIALCVMDDRNRGMIKHEDMAIQSKQLYQKRDELRSVHLEPYLFVLMLNWPRNDMTSRSPVLAREFSEIMKKWKSAFNRKYPRQREEGVLRPYRKRETTMFFLGKEPDMKSFVHTMELSQVSSFRLRADFWRTPVAHSRLARWRGILLPEGSDIELTLEQNGVKTVLNIPTSFPIQHRRWWNKQVYFVIGFTWTGPKAYDIDMEDPEARELVKPEESTQLQATTGPRPSAQVSNPPANPQIYLHTMFKKKLHGIKNKLRRINQLKQKQHGQLKADERQLLQKEKDLKREEAELIQNRQTTAAMFGLDL